MVKKSFFAICLKCFKKKVKITVDSNKDKFDLDSIKGKCLICNEVFTLRQLGGYYDGNRIEK